VKYRLLSVAIVAVALDSHASAECRTTRVKVNINRSAALRFEQGLVVVPFAVPVAVPVATFTRPSVLYVDRGHNVDIDGGAFRLHVPLTLPLQDSNCSPAPAGPTARDAQPETTAGQASSGTLAVGVLRTRCAACHSGAAAKGDLPIFRDDGAIVDKLPRHVMLEAIEQGTMPKEGEELSAAEIEAIRQWAKLPREIVY